MVFLTLTSQRTYYPLTGCKGSNFLFNDKANDLFFSHFVPKTDFESNKKSITIAFIFVVETSPAFWSSLGLRNFTLELMVNVLVASVGV